MSSLDISLLLNKKTVMKMGSQMNENAGSKPSAFAMKQMEKMGWTEGKGLGKTESGISKHITVAKRGEAAGLGSEAVEKRANDASENWWHDAFASNLKLMKNKHGKKSSSKKRKAGDEDEIEAPPSYDDLFKATGGARLGMRARADQKGKLKRTEDQGSAVTTSELTAEIAQAHTIGSTENVTTNSSDSEHSEVDVKKSKKQKSEKSEEKEEEKKSKKEKKEKKDKKDRKDKK